MSAPRRIRTVTSFDEYIPQPFDTGQAAIAEKVMDEQKDGKMAIKKAKGVEKPFSMGAMLKEKGPQFYDGEDMPKEAVWKKGGKKPPVMVSDLWLYVADFNARRAKERAVLCDNALMEARKQQEAAHYHSQQARLYEAAALRALRHGDNPGLKGQITAPALKMNEYPIPPDASWSSPHLLSPPGWEAPGAAQAPIHGPKPMNEFRIHTAVAEESSPWLAALMRLPRPPARSSSQGAGNNSRCNSPASANHCTTLASFL
jgi:hypothetical protein